MRLIIRNLQVLLVALMFVSVSAYAESWSCRKDNNVREVHITRSTSEPVPCKVVYKKLTEGVEDQVLWNAEHDASYCESKATAFVDKLGSWGWTCVETISGDTDPAVAPADTMPAEPSADSADTEMK